MPNRTDMNCPPRNPYEGALWLDEHLSGLLQGVPMHLGLQGVAELERRVFPSHLPLDPTCPTCGLETDEGQVELRGDRYRVRFESCGHVLDMTPAELQSRCRRTAKS